MTEKLSPNEEMKLASRGLRGTIAEDIQNPLTGAINKTNEQLLKFHGSYMQDDRDRRRIREEKKLEKDYSFMIRLRIAGGLINSKQWLGINEVADSNTTGIIKITTRQTVQFHGIVKAKLKPTMKWFDKYGLDAIAACGDVNRNVMAGTAPAISKFQKEVHNFANKISQHLLPKTTAYSEIWLDGEKLADGKTEKDSLYGKTYFPRKFKVVIAIPPHNEVDVFAHDVGLIAIEKDGEFIGFNLSVGGGLGMTHGNAETYPRIGTIIGYIDKSKILDVVWQIAAVQRDNGNRSNRSLARLKYTIDRLGIDWFKTELENRIGFELEEKKPYKFTKRGDYYGWTKSHDGLNHYTIFVENGRILDEEHRPLKTALKQIAKLGIVKFCFTANQNLILTDIKDEHKEQLNKLLKEYKILKLDEKTSNIRKDAIACVALNTCSQALAEGQRYMPDLLTKIEVLIEKHAIENELISIRMTGCPNGCARPYMAEIGLIGRSLGKYNIHLGGCVNGYRLNKLYKENANEAEILALLDEFFANFAKNHLTGENFGDFCDRILFSSTSF